MQLLRLEEQYSDLLRARRAFGLHRQHVLLSLRLSFLPGEIGVDRIEEHIADMAASVAAVFAVFDSCSSCFGADATTDAPARVPTVDLKFARNLLSRDEDNRSGRVTLKRRAA